MVVEGWQKNNCILYSVSQTVLKYFLTKIIREMFGYVMKFSYLCITNKL